MGFDRLSERRRLGTYRGLRTLASLAGLLVLAACVQVQPYLAKKIPPATRPARVLLMPPDVVILELSMGGVPLPRADWTAHAQSELVQAVVDSLKSHGAEVVRYHRAQGVVPYAP